MEEINQTHKLVKMNPFKKAWLSFSTQTIQVKISLLTLLVAVITIPSLTAFVTNTSNKENIEMHAQALSPTPVQKGHYTILSSWQTILPNSPQDVFLRCNVGDRAISGGLYDVNTNGSFKNWFTVRSTPGNSENPNIWLLTVVYTGANAQQFDANVLCLKNAGQIIYPTLTPPFTTPTPVCIGSGCPVTPTPKPSTGPLGLSISPTSVDVTIVAGETLKVLSVTSSSVTQLRFPGYPTSFGPGINWTVSSSGIAPGATISQSIQVNSNVPTGVYKGTGILINTATNAQLTFPVSVYIPPKPT